MFYKSHVSYSIPNSQSNSTSWQILLTENLSSTCTALVLDISIFNPDASPYTSKALKAVLYGTHFAPLLSIS